MGYLAAVTSKYILFTNVNVLTIDPCIIGTPQKGLILQFNVSVMGPLSLLWMNFFPGMDK